MSDKIFVPFMLGSISLIAFLSVRNTHLAGRTRDVCKLLLESKGQVWQRSYSLQLLYFVRRYKINNCALVSAILSVLCFGVMVALTFIPFMDWISTPFKTWVREMAGNPSVVALVAGGTLASVATVVSIYETYIGRRSLFAHVACTIIDTPFKDPNQILCDNLKQIEKSIRRPLGKKDNGDLKQRLNEVLKGLGTCPARAQAESVQAVRKDPEIINERQIPLD